MQLLGQQLLMGQPQSLRQGKALRRAVLGIAQNRAACMGAMDPQLVGPSRDGIQPQQASVLPPLHHGKPCFCRLLCRHHRLRL